MNRPRLDHSDIDSDPFDGYQQPDETGLDRRAGLARTIEGEIVPRLLMCVALARHNRYPSRSAAVTWLPTRPTHDQVEELARLVLQHECSVASAYVQVVRQHGVPMERIYTELLAPAARRLAQLWEQDACSIMQFGLGLSRLESVVREVAQHETQISAHP